jgi:hypothetical protein
MSFIIAARSPALLRLGTSAAAAAFLIIPTPRFAGPSTGRESGHESKRARLASRNTEKPATPLRAPRNSSCASTTSTLESAYSRWLEILEARRERVQRLFLVNLRLAENVPVFLVIQTRKPRAAVPPRAHWARLAFGNGARVPSPSRPQTWRGYRASLGSSPQARLPPRLRASP